MRQYRTRAIILSRTNYGEADRIITFLTPDHGKITAIAKGVRKSQSKLAGGIELFSVSDISFIPGRREIDTVVSTRLIKHCGAIVKDLDRTNLGYALIKRLNKATEDAAEQAYFDLLQAAFEALDDNQINLALIDVWFNAQLLKLAGHSPNLQTEKSGQRLAPDKRYDFNFESMAFGPGKSYNADHIKFLRLLFSGNLPGTLQKIKNQINLVQKIQPIIAAVSGIYLRS